MFKKWKNKKTWNWFESCFLPRSKWGKKKQKKEQNWTSSLAPVGRDLSISPMQKLLFRIPIKWLGRFGLWKERNGLFHSLSYSIFPRALPYLVMSLPSLPVTERAKTKKTDGLCGEVTVGSSSSFIHTYSIAIQQQYGKKKEVKTELTIHWFKRNKGKKGVAAKGAELSSWLLPQSGYKWVEVVQYW